MGDIQQHLAIVEQSATDFFIQRLEEPMHLEADGACSRLPFTRARGVLSQVGQIRPARSLSGQVPFDLAPAAIVDKDLQVHLRFAAELVDVPEELSLIGADGFAKGLVVVKDGAETEGKNRGMTITVRNNAGVVHAGFLVKGRLRIVLAYNHRKITCRVKKNLIATDSKDRFHRNRFTMTL